MLLHGLAHLVYCLLHTVGFCEVVILGETSDSAFTAVCGFLGELLAERHIVLACNDEESGNHQALCLGAFSLVLCCLETLVRIPREAVEVEAVVPVGTSDEWQLVRTEVVDDMVHRNLQVLEETYLAARLVVERHLLGEDGEVARLLYVSHGSEDEPAWIIVESATDVVVAALGEWLILMIAAAVWELGAGNVDDALPCTGGNLMHKANEVLVGVAEAHATTDAALEETCRARHAESNHALILVPDVHHAV